jgi:hypothetical protein
MYRYDNEMHNIPSNNGFTQIAVSDSFACGIRSDMSGVCWGASGVPSVPSGKYKTLAVSYTSFVCFIREDNTFWCGDYLNSVVFPPSNVNYTQLSISSNLDFQGCALKEDNTVTCFASAGTQTPSVPSTDTFLSIDISIYAFCGIKADGTSGIQCYATPGYYLPSIPSPNSGFIQFDMDFQNDLCAVRSDTSVVCTNQYSSVATPNIGYDSVGVVRRFACGLKYKNTPKSEIKCWGTFPTGAPAAGAITLCDTYSIQDGTNCIPTCFGTRSDDPSVCSGE